MYGIMNSKLDKNEFAKFIGENAVKNKFVMYNLFDEKPELEVIKAKFFKVKMSK